MTEECQEIPRKGGQCEESYSGRGRKGSISCKGTEAPLNGTGNEEGKDLQGGTRMTTEIKAGFSKGGVFIFVFFWFLFWIFFCFSWLLASGFCGFWLLWLLASVASGFCGFWLLWLLASVASGFCGFWLLWLSWLLWLLAFVAFGFLAYPSICLYLSIYLSIYLSFFLSFGSCSPFSFCICFSCCFRCRDETKQGSKQASKHELLTFGSGVLLGRALRPPPPPPRATKSALHPRHPRLPRNQYFKVNSPVQNFLTKQICLLYLSIYLILSNLI